MRPAHGGLAHRLRPGRGQPGRGPVRHGPYRLLDALPRGRLLVRGGTQREPPRRGFTPVLVPAPQPQPGRSARPVGVAQPGPLGRLARRGGAHGVREPRGELVARVLAEPGAQPRGVHRPQPRGGRVHVGRDPAARGAAFGHELPERLAQFPDAVTGERGDRKHGRARFAVLPEGDAVLVEQPPQIVEHLFGGLPGKPVHLVEDEEHDLRVARHGPQIALVQDGVGVLLRIDDPDDGVDERQDAVDLLTVLHGRRVVVGEVHQNEAAQLRVAVGALDGASAQPPGDAEPVDERRGAVAPTARDGCGGGGLGCTPVSEIATPASALNSADLPLPVALTRATTVCCPESLRRAAASSRTRLASESVRLSSRVRDSPTSSRRASRRDRSRPS